MIDFQSIEEKAKNIITFEDFMNKLKNYKNNLKEKSEEILQNILNSEDQKNDASLMYEMNKIIKRYKDFKNGKIFLYVNDNSNIYIIEDNFIISINLFIADKETGKHSGFPLEVFHVSLTKNDYSKLKMLYDV